MSQIILDMKEYKSLDGAWSLFIDAVIGHEFLQRKDQMVSNLR